MNKEIKIITLGDIFENIETEEKAFKFKDYIKDLQQKVEQLEKKENEKLKKLIQWLEVNIKNLKRQKANNLYMSGVKQGMIKNADLILCKVRDLLEEE